QLLLQGQMAQMRIAAADDLTVTGQRAGEGTEAVVEHQQAAVRADALFMHMSQQVFVSGVEGLQRLVPLLGLANQVERGKGRGENRHGNRRCLSGVDCARLSVNATKGEL